MEVLPYQGSVGVKGRVCDVFLRLVFYHLLSSRLLQSYCLKHKLHLWIDFVSAGETRAQHCLLPANLSGAITLGVLDVLHQRIKSEVLQPE